MKQTDLNKAISVAINYLYIEPVPIDEFPIFVHHPIFESVVFSFSDGVLHDMNEEPDAFQEYINYLVRVFQKSKTIYDLLIHIRNPYKLDFIADIQDYLSDEDFGNALRESYILTEFPYQNGINKVKELFELADPKYLMDSEDYEYWSSLPDKIKIYRGGNHKAGMSWTLSQEKAKWFANRFNKNGKVFQMTIDKSDTFAYFSDRGEQEIIVNPDVFGVSHAAGTQ